MIGKRLLTLTATLGLVALTTALPASAQTPDSSSQTMFALTGGNELLRFSSTSPGTIDSRVAISGLQGGESITGIDFRPATGALYGVGSTGRLYVISTENGSAVQSGAALNPGLSGGEYGVDFNPAADRLRVISDAEQNLRINVDSGAVITDGALGYASGDAGAGTNPRAVAAAYTNSVNGTSSTTLYDIDSDRDMLVRQAPPNDGVLVTVGPLGVDVTDVNGFDIVPQVGGGNAAYAVLTPTGGAPTLYSINLQTGDATSIGTVAGGQPIRGLAATLGPRARDGQSLFTQSFATRATFEAVHGAQAPSVWANAHNAELTSAGR